MCTQDFLKSYSKVGMQKNEQSYFSQKLSNPGISPSVSLLWCLVVHYTRKTYFFM